MYEDEKDEDSTEGGGSSDGERGENYEKACTYLGWITAREKEFDTGWWRRGKAALDMYNLEKQASGEQAADSNPYNILYSNTEVLAPSLYSAIPKPDVRERFAGGKLKPVPEVVERFLKAALDTSAPGEESFHDAMEESVISSLTVSSGVVRLRHNEGALFPLTFESVFYKNFLWGKGRKWSKVPWVAFRHEMSPEAFQKKFDISDEGMSNGYSSEGAEDGKKGDCCVYEFWHKASRTVWFLSEEWGEKIVKEPHSDPMKLAGFYPTPGLLCMTKKPGTTIPTPLYEYYRNQAEELNRVTVRLNRVLSAIRVRGAYSSLIGTDMKNILSDTEMENGLVEANNPQMLAQGGGFDKHIWLLPIEKLVNVAQQLYQAREAIKQVIFELTGISDIIRGSSQASETATASDLKNKWGTIRLRRMQSAVALYIRDLLRMAVDAGVALVPPAEWKAITQMPLPLAAEKEVALQQAQFLKMQAAEMAQMAPPGSPPPPAPPENPMLKMPTWEEILEKISDDAGRNLLIDIETSSTVDIDTGVDKQEVAEYMNAMGQLLNSIQPLVMMGGPSGVNAVKAILVAVTQKFKFGQSIIEPLEALQSPPPPPPEPPKGPPPPSPEEQAAVQAEAQAKMARAQMTMQQIELDKQLAAARHDLEMSKVAAAKQGLQLELEKAEIAIQEQRLKLAVKQKAAAQPEPKNAPV